MGVCLYLCPCAILSQGLICLNFICKMLVALNLIATKLKSQHENSNNRKGSSLTSEGFRKYLIPFTLGLHFDFTEAMWHRKKKMKRCFQFLTSTTLNSNSKNQRCSILP